MYQQPYDPYAAAYQHEVNESYASMANGTASYPGYYHQPHRHDPYAYESYQPYGGQQQQQREGYYQDYYDYQRQPLPQPRPQPSRQRSEYDHRYSGYRYDDRRGEGYIHGADDYYSDDDEEDEEEEYGERGILDEVDYDGGRSRRSRADMERYARPVKHRGLQDSRRVDEDGGTTRALSMNRDSWDVRDSTPIDMNGMIPLNPSDFETHEYSPREIRRVRRQQVAESRAKVKKQPKPPRPERTRKPAPSRKMVKHLRERRDREEEEFAEYMRRQEQPRSLRVGSGEYRRQGSFDILRKMREKQDDNLRMLQEYEKRRVEADRREYMRRR